MSNGTILPIIHELKLASVDGTIPAGSTYVDLASTIPSGYKLLGWMHCHSSGWAGFVYFSNMTPTTCRVYMTETATADRGVRAWYLYYR